MKRTIVLLILFMTLSIGLFAKNKQANEQINQIEIINQKQDSTLILYQKQIESLQEKNKDLETKQEHQAKQNNETLSHISAQLTASSHSLDIFSIIFAVGAIIIGIYVTWIEQKTKKLKIETSGLLNETRQTKDEVTRINEQIHSDIRGLYERIKREETVYLLRRLVEVPEDISNLATTLLSRELKYDDYLLLKEAYVKIKDHENEFMWGRLNKKDSYLLLFFQHFLDLATKDEVINTYIIPFYEKGIECAFKNDIIKSTTDFMKVIKESGLAPKQTEIDAYFTALSKSKYKNLNDLYMNIFNTFEHREDHFQLYSLLSKIKENRTARVNYGNMLIEKYGDINLSSNEQVIIDEIKQITIELEEEQKERETQAKEKS